MKESVTVILEISVYTESIDNGNSVEEWVHQEMGWLENSGIYLDCIIGGGEKEEVVNNLYLNTGESNGKN